MKIVHYLATDGKDPFDEWLQGLSQETRARILTRLDRVEHGNFGDHKIVSEGVWELRFTFGPGYRVYYGRDGMQLVVLLGGGTKGRQARDIEVAQTHWTSYKREQRHAN